VALWATCGLLRPWIDPRGEIALKQAHQPEGFWVAEADGVVVGTVVAGFDGRRGWMNYLAVAPGWRHRGLGAALVGVAERDLAARGCPKVNLQVRHDNGAVLGFYAALGYAEDHVVSLGKRLPVEHEPAAESPAP
jgi:ribosomal protein S18 acetylase RimI-like enzyme